MPKSRCAGGRPVMSRSACNMRPVVAGSSPAMARSNVVLPQPDGPTKVTNSLVRTVSDTSRKAVNDPKVFHTPCTIR